MTTVHDLLFLKAPEAHFGLMALGMRVLVPLAAHRSDRVIAVSTSTADDLATSLRVPRSKIDVVPEAAGSAPPGEPTPEPQLREQLRLGDAPVVLSVSAKRPHKNLPRLLRAMSALSAAAPPTLVIPGYPTEHERELWEQARALGIEDRLRMPGWLPREDLEGLYGLADAFVFPSLYEGFGLPVLEALRRGVPVACSNTSSLPEVAGDAALLFDPHDERAITRALERLLGDRRPGRAAARRRAAAGGAVQLAGGRGGDGAVVPPGAGGVTAAVRSSRARIVRADSLALSACA